MKQTCHSLKDYFLAFCLHFSQWRFFQEIQRGMTLNKGHIKGCQSHSYRWIDYSGKDSHQDQWKKVSGNISDRYWPIVRPPSTLWMPSPIKKIWITLSGSGYWLPFLWICATSRHGSKRWLSLQVCGEKRRRVTLTDGQVLTVTGR